MNFDTPLLLFDFELLNTNRLILSAFALLISTLLFYFWGISKNKVATNNKNNEGLVYLGIAFLLYFVLGCLSVFQPIDESQKIPEAYLIINTLISLSFISSLSFFAIGTHPIDKMVTSPVWKNSLKYFAFAMMIGITIVKKSDILSYLDSFIYILSFTILGFFISRYFFSRRLKFIGILSAIYFISVVLLQLIHPYDLVMGKFVHMNTIILGPALPLSVILLAYTFNWINELNFYELSNIWVSNDGESIKEQEASYSDLTASDNREDWIKKIAKDKIEKVIEEIIIQRKLQNRNLETILNIAARNTRNNNNQLKGIIKYEDYQLNRNQVSNALLQMIQK